MPSSKLTEEQIGDLEALRDVVREHPPSWKPPLYTVQGCHLRPTG
jgi:hypothetical protein